MQEIQHGQFANAIEKTNNMATVAVIILTYNEEKHIQRALQSISSFATEIFVIDSFSTDKTVEIAHANGATVLQHKFVNYAKQFAWGLANAPITSEWIMRFDADEIVEADLSKEISERLPGLDESVVGINLNRKLVFMGRWIKHGGRYPMMLLRIWRRGKGQIEDMWMDEHIVVEGGSVITFKGGLTDCNLNNLSFFTEKHNKYATREAIDILNKQLNLFAVKTDIANNGSSSQAGFKRFAKIRFYNRIPFQASALMYFLYRYLVQLGFLDRTEGLIYHVLQAFWYRFLVGAKLAELERAIEGLTDPLEILAVLQRSTGLELAESSSTDD